jgi:predicted NUDIX family NTP pyrophosphohydrolase
MTESAGILLFRRRPHGLEVLLAHPGGPYWRRKDAGAWTIPKGMVEEGEERLDAARREFTEELGFAPPEGVAAPLEPLRQPSRKLVHAWALEGDCDVERMRSILFEMEWPPGSGRMQSFPEVDRAGWFTLEQARAKMLKGQRPFLDQLEALVARP